MDYKEFLDKKFLDDVAKEKNEIKVTEIDDFIGVFDNAAPKSYCKLLIDYFDKMINPRLAALAEIAWCTKGFTPSYQKTQRRTN